MEYNELKQTLKAYVEHWASQDQKPRNEKAFVDAFCDLLYRLDDSRDVTFDGYGSYFGRQVTIMPDRAYNGVPKELHFEVSYSDTKISVYTAYHHGFWTPEYLKLQPGDEHWEVVREALQRYLLFVFGFSGDER